MSSTSADTQIEFVRTVAVVERSIRVRNGNVRYYLLQPGDYSVLGANLRERRFFVPQGPQEAGADQSKTTVRLGYFVSGFC